MSLRRRVRPRRGYAYRRELDAQRLWDERVAAEQDAARVASSATIDDPQQLSFDF